MKLHWTIGVVRRCSPSR